MRKLWRRLTRFEDESNPFTVHFMAWSAVCALIMSPAFAAAQAPPQAPPQPPPMACEEARGHLSALYEQATVAEKSYREQAVIAARKLAVSEQALKASNDELAKLKAQLEEKAK